VVHRPETTEPVYPARIRSIAWEATDVFSFILTSLDGTALPPFEPGSHIDLQLPNGLRRSYSLSNDGKIGAYRITVARDSNSTGGSTYLADTMRPGTTIEISAPRNDFPLEENAPLSVFIAGGIGVTPFLPMMARLNERGRRWRIHYCVRTRDRAALLNEIGG
jgi:ferredoxin-NADP reductase